MGKGHLGNMGEGCLRPLPRHPTGRSNAWGCPPLSAGEGRMGPLSRREGLVAHISASACAVDAELGVVGNFVGARRRIGPRVGGKGVPCLLLGWSRCTAAAPRACELHPSIPEGERGSPQPPPGWFGCAQPHQVWAGHTPCAWRGACPSYPRVSEKNCPYFRRGYVCYCQS